MSRHFALILAGIEFTASTANAGAILDLRSTPPIPEFGYDLNQNVHIDLFLVDNATGQSTSFTGVPLNSGATDSHLSVGPTFNWINPGVVGSVFSTFPVVSWIYPLPTPNPALQITLSNGGEVKLGDFNLNVGTTPGVFELNLLSGAQFSFTGGQWTDLNARSSAESSQFPSPFLSQPPGCFWPPPRCLPPLTAVALEPDERETRPSGDDRFCKSALAAMTAHAAFAFDGGYRGPCQPHLRGGASSPTHIHGSPRPPVSSRPALNLKS